MHLAVKILPTFSNTPWTVRGVHELNWQLDGHNFQTSKFVGAVSKCYHHKGLRGKFRLDSFFRYFSKLVAINRRKLERNRP